MRFNPVGFLLAAVLLVLLAVPLRGEEPAGPPLPPVEEGRTVWAFWPFAFHQTTPEHTRWGVLPLFTYQREAASSDWDLHVLWPLYKRRSREQAFSSTNRKSTELIPLYYSTEAERDGKPFRHRYLFPFYWDGQGTEGGNYRILFPFYWHARDAQLVVPLFPPRPQTFQAYWPLIGEFRGFWARDRIRFLLWPLFVHSQREGEAGLLQVNHFVWPFFSYIRGDKTRGFRAWPLIGHVRREGDFNRWYWLWPLGHHRTQRDPKTGEIAASMTLFIPFYGRLRAEKLRYDMVFPLYGRIEMPGRVVRGWALAIYNQDDNLRTGVRRHRLFWFIGRWRTKIPATAANRTFGEPELDPLLGWGVWPLYTTQGNSTQVRRQILWPVYTYRWDDNDGRIRERTYLMPFYFNRTIHWETGETTRRQLIWPVYRHWIDRNGMSYKSVLHLFPYTKMDELDRNWAPLWTIWDRLESTVHNTVRVRWAGGLASYNRLPDQSEIRRLDTFLVRHERWQGDPEGRQYRFDVLRGLAGIERTDGRTRVRLLWMAL